MTQNKSEYITINEAIQLTKKSKSTLRRFVSCFKDDDIIVKTELNKRNLPAYKINRTFTLAYFNLPSNIKIFHLIMRLKKLLRNIT